MISRPDTGIQFEPACPEAPAEGQLPPGTELQEIAFRTSALAGQQLLQELPVSEGRKAVLTGRRPLATLDSLFQHPAGTPDLQLVVVPSGSVEGSAFLPALRSWAEAAAAGSAQPCTLITLQGTQIVWAPGRIAVIAAAERIPQIAKVLVENAFQERELREVEQELESGWSRLSADSVLAFEFTERSVPRKKELLQRFQRMLELRFRLARLTPFLHSPHVHPPTLASQICERVRERARLQERLEFVSGQLEAHERVYEMCSQRASDFMVSRTGHKLEWIIILLLATQTFLWILDFVQSGSGQ